MSSIVLQLVKKDLTIMRAPTICWWLGGWAAIAIIVLGGSEMFNLASILFVSGMAGAGIHAVMRTVVEERREQTLAFIMSLPITIRQYTSAKLVANLAIFGTVWLTLSAATYLIFINGDALPAGYIPFLTIVLVAIFLAYTVILSASLVAETIGIGIAAIVGANIITQMFLWWVASLEGIRSTINGSQAVWNSTALTVLIAEIVLIGLLITLTYVMQARKKDFI